VKSCKAELHKIACNLRGDNATSNVLKKYQRCRFDYQIAAVLKQPFQKGVELLANVNESVTQAPMFEAIRSYVEIQCKF